MKIKGKNSLEDFMPISFKEFLIDHNLLDKYIYNFSKEKTNKINNFSSFFDERMKSGFLTRCFNWDNTPEGHEFWLQASLDWYHYNK